MKRPSVVRLTGRAARFLQILQDFGHLDEEQAARVMLTIPTKGRGALLADMGEVRRAAALQLFERAGGELDGLLAEDWPLLFS